jgi:hypothetical protein
LKSTSTGAVRKVVVNAEGPYEFAGPAPGEYELEAQATGFGAVMRRVGIEVGQRMPNSAHCAEVRLQLADNLCFQATGGPARRHKARIGCGIRQTGEQFL